MAAKKTMLGVKRNLELYRCIKAIIALLFSFYVCDRLIKSEKHSVRRRGVYLTLLINRTRVQRVITHLWISLLSLTSCH